jgi:ATP-dependent Clp protease ATP-binding subunit ClpA
MVRGGHAPERKQPDRAIDLLDQACALDRLRNPRPLTPRVAALAAERSRLMALESAAMDALPSLADDRGRLWPGRTASVAGRTATLPPG